MSTYPIRSGFSDYTKTYLNPPVGFGEKVNKVPELDIRGLTDEGRAKLVHKETGNKPEGLFVDGNTVYFFVKQTFGGIVGRQCGLNGKNSLGTVVLELPAAESVKIEGSVLIRIDTPGRLKTAQANIEISDFSEVKVGDGLTGAPRKFKLVPVE